MIDDSKMYALNTTVRGMKILKILRFGNGVPKSLAFEKMRANPENKGVPDHKLLYRQQKFPIKRRTMYRVLGTACGHESEMIHQTLNDRKDLDTEGYCSRCVRGAILEGLAAEARAKAPKGLPREDTPEALVDKLWKPTSGRLTHAN